MEFRSLHENNTQHMRCGAEEKDKHSAHGWWENMVTTTTVLAVVLILLMKRVVGKEHQSQRTEPVVHK